MSAGLHPHVGPKPRALSPYDRSAGSGYVLSLFPCCGISEHVAFTFIEIQTCDEPFGVYRSWTDQRLCEPFCDQRARLSASIMNFAIDRVFLGQGLLVSGSVFRLRNEQDRRPIVSIIVERIFGEIVEERGQLVKVFLSDRIELVIVAVRASHRQSQEGSAVSFGAFAFVVYA